MKSRPARLIAAALAVGFTLTISLTGCSSSSGATSSSLTIGLPEEPDTLDPQTTNAAMAQLILRYAGDTLVSLDPSGSGKIGPGLAKSWQESNNGLRWTFNLKSGVKFQNNDALDASAVKASFARAMDPATKAGIAASLVKPIKDIRAVGSSKIVIDLKYKYSLFLQNLASPGATIVDAQVAQKMGKQFGRSPVLSGPWKVTKWASGDHITLTRNAAYAWGPPFAGTGPAKLRTVTFRVIPDDATRVAALQSGDIQAATAIPPSNMKGFASDSAYQNYQYLRPGVGLFLEFNVTKPPFDDIRVRKALNYAIDKNELVKVALLGQGQAACGPLPPSIPGYWSGMCDYAPSLDLAKAKAALAQAGWTPGPDGILQKNGKPFAFTLYSSATPSSWNSSAQLIQQQLKKIGITVKIENLEFGTLLSKAQKGEDVAHLMGYTYQTADILDLWFRSTNIGTGLNLSHVNDPRLDGLISAYQRQVSPAATQKALVQAQKAVSDASLWVPLWVQEEDIAATANLHGAQLSKLGYLILNKATLGS
jgi:peptide/nickel transport system substrate-binding protein